MSLLSALTPVDRLLARHGLPPARTTEPLSGGRLNTVLRLDGELVLRCRDPHRATGSLLREAALLPRLAGLLPVPEVVAWGVDDLLGEYLLQTWLPGEPLLRAWLTHPDTATREWWIEGYVQALRALQSVSCSAPGELPRAPARPGAPAPDPATWPSWRACVEHRIRRRLHGLHRVPGVDRELLQAVERYLRRHSPALTDGPWCVVHRDLHFGNLLVEGPRVTAVLDFELAEAGPPDYELDTLWRFLDDPAQFAEVGGAAHATPARFASVWARLRRACPPLFAVPHLRVRLSLYALDHALSSLLQLQRRRGFGEPASAVEEQALLRRLGDIFQGRYGPE